VDRIEKSALEEVVVTNSIQLQGDLQNCRKIRVLSVGNLLAQAVQSIHEETSVSGLFI
jgi:ribose-phosphate pyrophosphokinase